MDDGVKSERLAVRDYTMRTPTNFIFRGIVHTVDGSEIRQPPGISKTCK